MDQKQAIALRDTLDKLPKWVRTHPGVEETIGTLIVSGAPDATITITKINRKKQLEYILSVTQTVDQFGAKRMRQLVVVFHPTDKVTEITTFSEA